jgi:predicted DNA-binding transcriptional regulator AlpA
MKPVPKGIRLSRDEVAKLGRGAANGVAVGEVASPRAAPDQRIPGPSNGSRDGVGLASGTTIDSDRLLTVAQTVKLTGYSEESVRRWIRKGALPVERVGPYRRVRVRSSVLRKLFPT